MAVAAPAKSEAQTIARRDRPGFHGYVFLAVSAAITAFFLARAVAMIAQGPAQDPRLANASALGIFIAALAGFGYLALRLLNGPRGTRAALAIEESGIFSAKPYKRTLGLLVRRLTILGIGLIFGSGIYTLYHNGWLDAGNKDQTNHLYVRTPFLGDFPVLPDIHLSVPLLLIALGLWVAWRAVNIPAFADFLIATEAEINKVSWPTKKQLIRDTVVVLVSLALFTAFFFLVDVFWGWLLSREWVGVLPSAGEMPKAEKAGPPVP